MLEGKFKTQLIREIESELPGCLIIHPNPNVCQGIPDLIILFGDKWAALEGKKCATSSHRPNQDYYISVMNRMSYASFVYPENKEVVLDELQQALCA